MTADDDRVAIAALVRQFFDAFRSGPEYSARLDALPEAFLADAVIIRTCGTPPAVYDVAGFIAPRRELLTSGTLEDFREWEMSGRTEVFGDIAHHFCSYAKSWRQNGQQVEGRGTKSIQLVRTAAGWRISAVAWDDVRPGLDVPAP